MTSTEFWLLESVVEVRHPLSMLLSDNVQSWFNRPHHGLNEDGMLQHLDGMMQSGHLIGYIEGEGSRRFTRDEIASGLRGEFEGSYALTPAGGARWEAAAKANWDKFFDESYGEDDELGQFRARRNEFVGSIVTAKRNILEEYLLGVQFNGFTIDEPSRVFDEMKPWQATYWKELPEGHRVRFLCVFTGRPQENLIPEWFRDIRTWHGAPEL